MVSCEQTLILVTSTKMLIDEVEIAYIHFIWQTAYYSDITFHILHDCIDKIKITRLKMAKQKYKLQLINDL